MSDYWGGEANIGLNTANYDGDEDSIDLGYPFPYGDDEA